MVLHTELTTAQSEATAFRDEIEIMVKQLEWKDDQLAKLQELLNSVSSEAVELQAQMRGMVSKSEVFVTRAESDTLLELIEELHGAKTNLEDENIALIKTIQVKKIASVRHSVDLHFKLLMIFAFDKNFTVNVSKI